MKIQQELRHLADLKIARGNQRFFKTGQGEYGEGDIFLGIKVPTIRQVAKKYHDLELKYVLRLVRSKFHEERLTGLIILVNQYSQAKTDLEKNRYYGAYVRNFRYINNWDLVDVTCHKIIGPHLKNDRGILYKWARSKNLWTKRISIVSTFWFVRKNDLKDALVLSEILLNDRHDLIHKAVGWVLREVGKKDRKAMESFLVRHYRKMPRTMLRYAIERLPEARRQQYLRGTV